MRVIVCGGRKFSDKDWLFRTLYNLCDACYCWGEPHADGNNLPSNIKIISGMAAGADSLALDWAIVNWTELKGYPANWKKYGKAAGMLRNQQMLDEEKPHLVVAFPGGKGTADMVARAKAAKVQVILPSQSWCQDRGLSSAP